MRRLMTVACAACVAAVASAKDVTWTGGGSGWADPNNWSEAPADGDIAVIPENVTVEAGPVDKVILQSFAACRIEKGATLFLNAISFKWDDNHPDDPNYCDTLGLDLSGSGCFRAEGGKTCLTGDNRAFVGTFVTTNNALYCCKPYSFYGTNHIYSYSTSGNWETHEVRIQRVNGPSVISNNLHLSVGEGRMCSFYNGKNPLHFYGNLEINAKTAGAGGMFSIGAQKAYDIHFHGKQTGNGYLIFSNGDAGCTNYHFEADSEIDMEGGLFAFAANVALKGKITRAVLDAGRGEYGFFFGGENLSNTNCTWFFNRTMSYVNGGQFDLSGYSQKVGDICIEPNTNPFPGCVIKSDKKATLTCCGSMGRDHPNVFNYFGGVLKGQVSFCYDYDGRPGPLCGSRTNPAGKFIFTGTGSDTSGGLSCRRGELTIASTAEFPNITELKAYNAGAVNVEAAGLGAEGEGLVVTVADSGVLTIGADVTIAAKSACIGGKWIDPKPGETYGGPQSAATVKLDGLAGTGILTVAEYGGPKGLMMILR